VILTITGTYGIAAVVPSGFGPANINQHSVKLEVSEEILPNYLIVFLNSYLCRPQFDRAVTGSSRLALDYPAIRNLRILYPSDKNVQQGLANAVGDKMDRVTALRREAESVKDEIPKIPSEI
jgi:type I restriction enzyme S subunit